MIRRPSPRNDFCYEMLSHPFGLPLSEVQLETLSQVKAFAQQHFSHSDMLSLDDLLKKIVLHSSSDDPGGMIEKLFLQSRSFDYGGTADHIHSLERWILSEQLLRISYVSPHEGRKSFYFLPVALYYNQGALYIRGERPDRESPSSLRLDRILGMEVVEQPDVLALLQRRKNIAEVVVLHILVETPSLFDGLGLTENQGVYEETCQWIEAVPHCYYEVTLKVRESFYLTQRLLALGYAFRILTPTSLREEMKKTLEHLLGFYRKTGASHCE